MKKPVSSLLRTLVVLALAAMIGYQVASALSRSPWPDPIVQEAALQPDAGHPDAARAIVDRLKGHYVRQPLDDRLSSQILDRYLKSLDPNRVYFLAADIEAIDRYRTVLDDQLRRGELGAGFDIYALFLKRSRERLAYLVERVEAGFDDLDFKSGRSYLIDRSEQPWPATEEEMAEIWEGRLIDAVIAMRLDGVDDDEIKTRLLRRYQGQLNRLGRLTAEDVFEVYMNALTQTYDPHTNYMSPVESQNFNMNMSRSLEGIGAVLQADEEYTRIVSLLPGGPAQKSGLLKPADRIVGVGQEQGDLVNVIGWRLEDVVNLIRGPKGTRVRLEIIPAGSASEHSTREVVIERNRVVLEEQAAKKRIIEVEREDGVIRRIAVIRIPAFYMDFDAYNRGDANYTSTTRDVIRLLQDIQEDEFGVDGLIVDLRNNGGGSLHEATQLVSLFIDGGPTVLVRDARGVVNVERDRIPGALYQGPMAVLVNRFSASASEIFAGAMQDYGRALVVGDRTFGKGTVQTLLPLPHGQLKITQSKFYRVSGSSNQNLGIVPDIELPYLVNHDDVGESALTNALPWDRIPPARYTPYAQLGDMIARLKAPHDARVDADPDFAYVRAMRSLLEQERERTAVSLNEAQRRRDQERLQQQQLTLENARRKAQGEPPLKDMAEFRALSEQRALELEDGSQDKGKPDPYLTETGSVLADLIDLKDTRNGSQAAQL